MKILVTGGAGFIGSHLANKLKELGHQVVIFDNLASGSEGRTRDSVFIKGDILDKDAVKRACEGVEAIYHLAADPSVKDSVPNPEESFRINVIGTMNLLEEARKKDIKKFIFTSSSTVYGNAAKIPTTEGEPYYPISPYGSSKACCDCYLSAYSESYGMDCVSVIYANIYGPESNHGVMYDFYHKLKKDPTRLVILGNGLQKKSYLYIRDCIKATMLAAEKTKGYERYNIGSEQWSTVNEIANIMAKVMGISPKYEYTGGQAGWKGDVPKMRLSVEKIKSLGWTEETALEQGIREYVKWLDSISV